MYPSPHHKFHIPVMGLAFTIDSPVKVARFGIASVLSIVEDRLIETMRSYYYPFANLPFVPITAKDKDYRAKRITDYLNLINHIVNTQIRKLKNEAFEAGSEIIKYFEMLPEDNRAKQLYRRMLNTENSSERNAMEASLREQVIPGSIDVNIMTKLDKNNADATGELLEDGSDAVAALRGYAGSNLSNSSIVFSAGLNPRLYNFLEKCREFDADDNGVFTKKIIIKVSDYRSALIQGKYLAKKGIWVSEFRIESGLNCGGHAFATDGFLLGPILQEFKNKKEELASSLFDLYNAAIKAKGKPGFTHPHPVRISVQGGIGTAAEHTLLHEYFGVSSTGWGTPFLLVPEATTVDEPTLKLLSKARKEDIELSDNSPLGVPFHYLKNTSGAAEKRQRVLDGKPGSPCTEKHLVSNTEFTKEPICTASTKYQKLKIAQLQTLNLPENEYQRQVDKVLEKECLCIGLSNSAPLQYDKPFLKKLTAVTICPGPNIVHFSEVVSLQTMVNHIYGKTDVVKNIGRPHMFIAELALFISYLEKHAASDATNMGNSKIHKYYSTFIQNLLHGISYYRSIQQKVEEEQVFGDALDKAEQQLAHIARHYDLIEPVSA